MKILIVEDSQDMLDTLLDHFQHHHCFPASSSEQASILAGKNRFDLVITDLNLSNGNSMGGGIRIISEVRSKHDTAIFVYSGEMLPDTMLKELGVNRSIAKPNILELSRAVSNLQLHITRNALAS